ncbi:MAG: beta-galactosidase [Nitrospirota bacterium]
MKEEIIKAFSFFYIVLVFYLSLLASYVEAFVILESFSGIYLLGGVDHPVSNKLIAMPDIKGSSIRARWKNIEPSEGKYNWSYLDTEIKKAKAHKKSVTLRILTGVWSPDWLYKKGTSQFVFMDRNPLHKRTYGKSLRMPIPWDESYLKAWEVFIMAMGNRFGKDPAVVMVHLSGPTCLTAEMNLPHKKDNLSQWERTGYSPEKLIYAWQRSIDVFAQAFPNKPIVLNLARRAIYDDRVIKEVISYGSKKYGQRFLIQMNALMADKDQDTRRPDIGWVRDYADKGGWVGFQLRRGNRLKGPLLDAMERGLVRGARYFEVYQREVSMYPDVLSLINKRLDELMVSP